MKHYLSVTAAAAREAYNTASTDGKKVLEALFGKELFTPKDITERVKTFEDAVAILGNDNQAVIDYYAIADATCAEDILAMAKLKVVAEALNEGWRPKFDEKEYRYYPWFYVYPKEKCEQLDEDEKKDCCAVGHSGPYAVFGGVTYVFQSRESVFSAMYVGSWLSFKTKKLAEYCGRQFIEIWEKCFF